MVIENLMFELLIFCSVVDFERNINTHLEKRMKLQSFSVLRYDYHSFWGKSSVLGLGWGNLRLHSLNMPSDLERKKGSLPISLHSKWCRRKRVCLTLEDGWAGHEY